MSVKPSNWAIDINAFTLAFRIGFGLVLGAGLAVLILCSTLEFYLWLAN